MLQLLDKSKYTRTEFVEGGHACRLAVNEPQFRSMKPIGDDIFEIQKAYRRIKIDVVMTNGINILFEAKMKLLQWHYSFLSYFLPKNVFSHVFCDTDSMYTAFAELSLTQCVLPEKRAEFDHLREGFCGKPLPPRAMLPRTCCSDCVLGDQKEPGLFKQEARADIIIALTSKTYVCVDSDNKIKMSCKGVNKRLMLRSRPLEVYKQVLESRVSAGSINRGFRSIKGRTLTYSIFRNAFPWLYLKRDVLPGGSYTKTLPVVLRPSPKFHLSLQGDLIEIGPDYLLEFEYAGYKVQTIRQAHCLMKYVYCDRFKSLSENHLSLMSSILKTTEASELHKLLNTLGGCEQWSQAEYDAIYYIVTSRMSQHAHLHLLLDLKDQRYIVNACHFNNVMGSGQNHRVTRFRKDAFLQGGNMLGKVYMLIRTTLATELLHN